MAAAGAQETALLDPQEPHLVFAIVDEHSVD